jgi:hypothetical protein
MRKHFIHCRHAHTSRINAYGIIKNIYSYILPFFKMIMPPFCESDSAWNTLFHFVWLRDFLPIPPYYDIITGIVFEGQVTLIIVRKTGDIRILSVCLLSQYAPSQQVFDADKTKIVLIY